MAKDPKYANMVKCINSDKLIEMLPKNINSYISVAAVIKIINNLPAADVQEVKHGKWELIDECANKGVYCSNCHKKVYRAEYANQKVKSKYCPNCGAKMDGDKNAK